MQTMRLMGGSNEKHSQPLFTGMDSVVVTVTNPVYLTPICGMHSNAYCNSTSRSGDKVRVCDEDDEEWHD